MTADAVASMEARSRSPAILMGPIFDDRGNPMSPSHANKKGVRYRYYVSHALLQNQKAEAGSIARVSAPEVEALVCDAVREQLKAEANKDASMRDLIHSDVKRIIISADQITVTLRAGNAESEADKDPVEPDDQGNGALRSDTPNDLTIPFAPALHVRRKGITHTPAESATMSAEARENLLRAIARSRLWMDDILSGKAVSFDDIAATENLAERHVRFLLPLAFLSPRIVASIANGTAPADLTISALARALPHAWSDQEHLLQV